MVEAVIEALGDQSELVEFVRTLAKTEERADASVPIRENEARIARIKAKAETEGRTVTGVVSAGVADFLAGDLHVTKPVRARRGTGQRDAMLNVRPSADLIGRLKERCAERAAAGESWLKPSVVYAAILDRYDPPAPDAPADDQG